MKRCQGTGFCAADSPLPLTPAETADPGPNHIEKSLRNTNTTSDTGKTEDFFSSVLVTKNPQGLNQHQVHIGNGMCLCNRGTGFKHSRIFNRPATVMQKLQNEQLQYVTFKPAA
ncbi:hypothetical protein DPEC_G00216300 [Dallia pectoralis]|uniref:Uncharacterized protein n=1 Tax=Dallia pectoralis TaxID=75939 RepID=A0ACC2G2L6_DALPE|nr:hypothetical protein DPEC_G00216300 [Dallia pectoralis]